MKSFKLFALLIALVTVIQCTTERRTPPQKWHLVDGYSWAQLQLPDRGEAGFEHISSSESGITFQNNLNEESYVENRVLLNGSGVAAGDINGDDLPDLYFTQIDGPNRLYLNEGQFRFRDITDSAGVGMEGYKSAGTVLADVDGDHDQDLLVVTYHRGTLLFMNDGSGRFTRNNQSGLDSTTVGGTTMTLADIDRDGDLDLYIARYNEITVRDLYTPQQLAGNNVAVRQGDRYNIHEKFQQYYTNIQSVTGPTLREVGTRDELYLNTGGTGENWKGFQKVDELKDRFLNAEGNPEGVGKMWSLTARFEDINDDGLPDLYVCNDFWTPDQFWINQGDGTFRQIDPLKYRHMSLSAMAIAVGDPNNDGHSDFFVSDMLSPVHTRRYRQIMNLDPFPVEPGEIDNQPQYTHNTLYINRGDNSFTETANFSGVDASGWSWASTFMDANLDGRQDLLINTGYLYDALDLDTHARVNQRDQQDPYNLQRYQKGQLLFPPLELPNKAYKNNGDLTFSDQSDAWGLGQEDVSQGMALADLNLDGALDVVSNRMNREAVVYGNKSGAPRIAVRLIGEAPNTQAVGAQVSLEGAELRQEKKVVSGGNYMSGSDAQLMFAAGTDTSSLSLKITWPDGKKSTIDNVQPNRIYKVFQDSITSSADSTEISEAPMQTAFKDLSAELNIIDPENDYRDYMRQPFIPIKLSQLGPGVAWLDYNRDGRTDLVQTSGEDGELAVFRNEGEGQFHKVEIAGMDAFERGDQTAIIGWQADGATHLVVGRSDYEQQARGGPSAYYYLIRNGAVAGTQQLPGVGSSTGPLAAADYNRDGTLDLFVGGRVVAGRYPESANSALFTYQEQSFTQDSRNTELLQEVGMVTGALFTDYNGDDWPDLLLSTSWGSLKLFENNQGQFTEVSEQAGLSQYQGWWNGIATGDFNADGRPDVVANNWGTNSRYQLVDGQPMRIYYGNLDGDSAPDLIQANYSPELEGYVPIRRLKFYQGFMPMYANLKSYQDYSESTLGEILGSMIGIIPYKEINTLKSMVFINEGDQFVAHPLPTEVQLTASFDASVGDYDNDGHEDIYLGQNFFDLPPGDTRLDGGRGLWLAGDGNGHFKAVPGYQSGIEVYGEQQGTALGDFDADGRVDLVATQNGNRTKLYQNQVQRRGFRIHLAGPQQNRDAIGATIRLHYENGEKGPARTVQAGSGYWSQNSAVQVLGFTPESEPSEIEIHWPDGTLQNVTIEAEKWDYRISYPK